MAEFGVGTEVSRLDITAMVVLELDLSSMSSAEKGKK